MEKYLFHLEAVFVSRHNYLSENTFVRPQSFCRRTIASVAVMRLFLCDFQGTNGKGNFCTLEFLRDIRQNSKRALSFLFYIQKKILITLLEDENYVDVGKTN